jgi:hypothetical protein
MQTYYELGYAHALEKLGMPAAAQRVVAAGKGVVQKLRGAGGSKATRQGMDAIFEGPKRTMVEQGKNVGLKAPAADPQLNAVPAPMTAPQGAPPLAKAPTVESKSQPGVKAPPAEKTKTKEVPQGFLSKYKWPLLGGAGLAGLGGYAYMKNRDPMGGYPVQGY